jgi:parvulin-like peptidyl-prolyl isomerase
MKKVLVTTATAAALAWVALTSSGCSGCGYDENKVIAQIGDKNAVTVGDFVYHYKRAVDMAPPQDKPVINTFDDAKDFLDDIITSRVLELEADKLGYGKDPQLKKDVDTYRSNLLRERVRSKIEGEVKVTEAEILDFYNFNKEWRRVSFIMCRTKDQADKAYAELKAGTPWNDVVKKYSVFEQNKEQGGAMPQDFYYSGDNVSRAVYETEVGKYTPVIETEDRDMWLIFRVDKKVPGQKEEYAKVKDNIRNAIKGYKVSVKTRERMDELRKGAEIKINRRPYDAVLKGKLADARAKYNRVEPATVIATVGGVPIYFESWFEGMFLQFNMSEEMLDEYKRKEPEEFKKVMDDRLRALEDDALLEFDAIRSGVDKEPDFNRDLNRFRAGKLVDRIYDEVFVPTIPEVTEAEIKEYFENHKDEFQDVERAEVEFVAMPKKVEAEVIRAKVLKGEDFMAASQEYGQKYFEALEKRGEEAKEPSPAEMPMADFLTVPRQPAPAAEAPSPQVGPAALIDELRPRVFKLKKGDVSEVFKLKDGRWAFFKYSEHYPFVQHTLDEKIYYDQAKDGAYREKMASPEVDHKCQAWFEKLRDKYPVDIDEGALKMAFKKVQKF